ncbi:MAG: preprotein translocase subunit SecG [Patescibacteria group bacterium]
MITTIIQLTSAIALAVVVLLQNRGTGLGSAFGGDGNVYRTKRGVEKVLFKATIVLAVVFLASSLIKVLF